MIQDCACSQLQQTDPMIWSQLTVLMKIISESQFEFLTQVNFIVSDLESSALDTWITFMTVK